jgi:hypothetical protein
VFSDIISQQLARITDFDLHRMMQQAVEENLDLFVETNQKQLQEGVDSEGQSLGTYWSYGGRSYKGGPLSPVDLHLTGDFYDSMDALHGSDGVELTASDYKTPDLQKWYGADILGVDLSAPTADDLQKEIADSARFALQDQIQST